MIVELFSWWYGSGWLQAIGRIYKWASDVERTFSAGLLLRTLFAPWRRIVTISGKSLDQKFRSFLDNLVSRFVGAAVRLIVLFVAGLAIVAATIFGMIVAVGWPLLPVAIIYFLVRGII